VSSLSLSSFSSSLFAAAATEEDRFFPRARRGDGDAPPAVCPPDDALRTGFSAAAAILTMAKLVGGLYS